MRTARSSSHLGGLHQAPPQEQEPPHERAPSESGTPQGAGTPHGLGPLWEQAPPQAGTPLWTESQTPVKTLPSRNFVCRR